MSGDINSNETSCDLMWLHLHNMWVVLWIPGSAIDPETINRRRWHALVAIFCSVGDIVSYSFIKRAIERNDNEYTCTKIFKIKTLMKKYKERVRTIDGGNCHEESDSLLIRRKNPRKTTFVLVIVSNEHLPHFTCIELFHHFDFGPWPQRTRYNLYVQQCDWNDVWEYSTLSLFI